MAEQGARAAWVRQLARLGTTRPPWRDTVRIPLSIAAPLAVGLAVEGWGHNPTGLAAGVLASIGGLVGSIAPQRGPVREKLVRTAAGIALGAAGLAVGRFAAGTGWPVVFLIAALAALAAFVSAINANFSFGALQFLIYIAVGSGLVTGTSIAHVAVYFVAGGAWALLLTLLAALSDPVDPDRAVVSDVLRAVADLLRQCGHGADPARRQAVTTALNTAYDQITGSRGHVQGKSPRLSRLAGVLNSAQPLVDGAVALYRSGRPAEPEVLAAVDALADGVLAGRRPAGGPPHAPDDDAPPARAAPGAHAQQQVRDGTRLLWDVVAGNVAHRPATPVRRDWKQSASDLWSRSGGSADSREFAVRLALCMAIAEVVREHLPYERPYWVLLTVAIVLKPDFGSVFARGVQRTVGTILGVLVGAAVLALVPHDGWMLLPLAAAAALMPLTLRVNYGLFVVSLTPVVVMLLDLAAPGDAGVVTARLVDTAVGSGIVLIFGYLLWPRTWRSTFDAALHAVIVALDAFVGATLVGRGADRRHVRRTTFRALTQLQTALQRQLAEPPPFSTRAAAWWPLVVQLERTADSVVEAGVAVDSGATLPDAGRVQALRTAICELDDPAATSCAGVPPEVTTALLAPIAREVDAACRLRRAVAAQGFGPMSRSGPAAQVRTPCGEPTSSGSGTQ